VKQTTRRKKSSQHQEILMSNPKEGMLNASLIFGKIYSYETSQSFYQQLLDIKNFYAACEGLTVEKFHQLLMRTRRTKFPKTIHMFKKLLKSMEILDSTTNGFVPQTTFTFRTLQRRLQLYIAILKDHDGNITKEEGLSLQALDQKDLNKRYGRNKDPTNEPSTTGLTASHPKKEVPTQRRDASCKKPATTMHMPAMRNKAALERTSSDSTAKDVETALPASPSDVPLPHSTTKQMLAMENKAASQRTSSDSTAKDVETALPASAYVHSLQSPPPSDESCQLHPTSAVTDAHNNLFCGSSSEARMTQSEYFACTEGYKQELERVFEKEYIDVTAGVTRAGVTPGRLSSDGQTRVEVGEVVLQCPSTHRQGRVWWVSGNFLSPLFKNRIFTSLGNSHFARDTDIGLQGKNRHIRISSLDSPTVFGYRHGKTALESEPCSDLEKDLLTIFNKVILEKQNALIAQELKSKGVPNRGRVKFIANELQIVIGSPQAVAFGKHRDSSPDLCHRDNNYTSLVAGLLPHESELQVATLVLVLCFDDADKQAEGVSCKQGDSRVYWYDGDGKILGQVATTQEFIHLQGHGCNSFFEQGIESIHNNTHCKRLVIGFRYTLALDFHEQILRSNFKSWLGEEKWFNDRKKRLHRYKNVVYAPVPLHCAFSDIDESPVQSSSSTNLPITTSCAIPNDSWKSSEHRLARPSANACVPSPVWQELRGPTATRVLFRNNCSLLIKNPKTKTEIRFSASKIPLGEQKETIAVKQEHFIPHSIMHHQVCHSDVQALTAVIPEHPYKNDVCKIGRYQDNVIDKKGWHWQGENDFEIWVGGSGGSPILGGAHTPRIIPGKKDLNVVRVANHQRSDIRGPNESMRFAVELDLVVELWAPHWWRAFSEYDNNRNAAQALGHRMFTSPRKDSTTVEYLGLWQFTRMELSKHPDVVIDEVLNSHWGTEKSYKFFLKPFLLNAQCPVIMSSVSNSQELEICTSAADISVGIGQQWEPLMHNKDFIVGKYVEGLIQNLRHDTVEYTEPDDEAFEEPHPLVFPSDHDLFHDAFRCSVAEFARMRFQNIFDNKAGPLVCGNYQHLGWAHATVPIPHPIRTYNVTTLAFIHACGKLTEKGCQRISASTITDEQMSDLLFRSIVLRTTGRVAAYVAYAKYRGFKGIHLPTIDDLPNFSEFLKCSTGLSGKMTPLVSRQYSRSLFEASTGGFPTYLSFLSNVQGQIFSLVSGWAVLQKQNKLPDNYRETFSEKLTLLLRESSNGVGKRADFISGHCIADIEEVLTDPFGPVHKVVFGPGGASGAKLLGKNGDKCAIQLLHFFRSKAPPELLDCMGLTRSSPGCVLVSLNSRPISLVDMEFVFCKNHLAYSHTTGARLVTDLPKPSVPHCHPLPFNPPWHQFVTVLANECLQNFHDLKVYPKIHSAFQMPDENLHWKTICSDFQPIPDTNIPVTEAFAGRPKRKQATIPQSQSRTPKKQKTLSTVSSGPSNHLFLGMVGGIFGCKDWGEISSKTSKRELSPIEGRDAARLIQFETQFAGSKVFTLDTRECNCPEFQSRHICADYNFVREREIMDVLGDQLLESVTFDYFWILDGVWLETDGLFGKTVPRLHRFLNSNGVIYVPLFLGTLRSMYVNTKYWKSLFEVTLLDEKDLGTVGLVEATLGIDSVSMINVFGKNRDRQIKCLASDMEQKIKSSCGWGKVTPDCLLKFYQKYKGSMANPKFISMQRK
jgi:hypothetical protein